MELKLEREITRTLNEIQTDIRHVKSDVDVLKSIMLEDAFLTEEEKKHLEQTIKDFEKGRTENFASLNNM